MAREVQRPERATRARSRAAGCRAPVAADGRKGRWSSRGVGPRERGTRPCRPDPQPASARPATALYGSRAGMVSALVLGGRGGIDTRAAGSLRSERAGAPALHLGVPRRADHRVGLPPRPAPAAPPGAGARGRGRRGRRLRRLSRLARTGGPGGGARACSPPAAASSSGRSSPTRCSPPPASGSSLLDPWAILDLGGWLSAAALWGALAIHPLERPRARARLLVPHRQRRRWAPHWPRRRSRPGVLGTVAPVGVGLNFLAIPIAAVAVPGVLASLLLLPGLARRRGGAGGRCGPLSPPAGAPAPSRGPPFPGGHVVTDPGLAAAVPWVVALAVALWATGQPQHRRRWQGGGRAGRSRSGSGSASAPALPRSGDGGNDLALHFLDVGQGDGAVLRTPRGRWVVIDAGRRRSGAMRARGSWSRSWSDTVRGPSRQWSSPMPTSTTSAASRRCSTGFPWARCWSRARRSPIRCIPGSSPPWPGARIAWHPARRGERFTLDGVRFTVLHPEPIWAGWGEDVNEDSVVLLVEYGAFQALFAGDAGFPAEEVLRSRVGRGGRAQGGPSREPRQHRRRLARRASAAARGHLGRAERLRAPGARHAGPAGGARGAGAPHRPGGHDHRLDRRRRRCGCAARRAASSSTSARRAAGPSSSLGVSCRRP